MAITQTEAAQTRPALMLVQGVPPPAVAETALIPPQGVAFFPTEQVLLLRVDMPAMPAAQRRGAVAFAVEDRIAQSLDEVQVVLGPQTAPGQWLVAVVAHAALGGYPSGRDHKKLWPDVFALPVPAVGWSVWVGAGRALVRVADGTGFATSTTALPSFWQAAGSPAMTLFGGTLAASFPVCPRGELQVAPDPSLAGFDLRAGRHAARGASGLPRGARALAAVLVVAALGHLALMVADLAALGRIAGQREAELRAALNAPADGDLEAALTRALAARQPADAGGLLPLLTRAFAALGAQSGRVTVQDLRYAAAGDTAILTLEAPDLGTLQAVETALNGAGLAVSAGAATTGNGAAEVQMTLRGGGA